MNNRPVNIRSPTCIALKKHKIALKLIYKLSSQVMEINMIISGSVHRELNVFHQLSATLDVVFHEQNIR